MHVQRFCLFGAFLVIHMILAFAARNDSVMCKDRERQALLNIKQGLTGVEEVLSSWGSVDDKRECCEWKGVTCSKRTGHVTELRICCVGGKVSESLLELRHLTFLDLKGNDFGGTQFPLSTDCKNGSLAKLKYLDLSDSNFGGTISCMLRNMSNLQHLDLSFTNFNDIGNSNWASGLSSLAFLALSGVQLISPYDWLEIASNKLLTLETLRLSSCFSGDELYTPTFPPINSSSSLKDINLSKNNLVIPSINTWLSNITRNIQNIDLSSNILDGSPLDDFGQMSSLQILYLVNTTLVGYLPKSFGNMSSLHILVLSRNKLNVQIFELFQNLSGPAERSLEKLFLDHNQLVGPLPDDLTRFSSLIYLFLGYNHLNGTITKSFQGLSQLQQLEIGWNSFTDVISENVFSNLTNLEALDLSGNSFIWNISLHWQPPFDLSYLRIRSCKIGPHFPDWVRGVGLLAELDISDNGIIDTVPDYFWSLSLTFTYLNISHNNLSGKVPYILYGFLVFDVSFNQFSGDLPPMLDQDGNALVHLDLSNNLFSGAIPDYAISTPNLVFLNLANNSLSGEISPSIKFSSKLESLRLENNKFFGEFPFSLKNCTNLRFLDLSNNKFSGNLPSWIGENLTSLQYLNLQSNQFHGNIPLQLCQLINVQILDLSINNFNGTIPHCLNNLRAMVNGNSSGTIYHFYYNGLLTLIMIKHQLNDQMNVDKALVLWKGLKYILDKTLGRFRIIDFSNNKLEGEIPREITALASLKQLNLSSNKLTGAIPEEIGALKQLESLDVSQNRLSGKLPETISGLSFLNTLNLSHNNFYGKIPLGTQLQTLSASVFSNNPGLCGLPLPLKCPGEDVMQVPNHDDGGTNQEDEFKKSLYLGSALGFIVGFWGVSGTLLFKRSHRHAFFKFLDELGDWFYVRKAVCKKRIMLKIKGRGFESGISA